MSYFVEDTSLETCKYLAGPQKYVLQYEDGREKIGFRKTLAVDISHTVSFCFGAEIMGIETFS